MGVLDSRHALITGGLGTIGREMAGMFIAAGAQVTVLDRPGGAAPNGMGWLGCDLDDPAGAEAAVAALAAAQPVDILINNAALILNQPFESFSTAEYEQQMRINSTAAFALVRACAPAMKARCWGRIVNLTSLTLNGEWDGYVPYVASKGALLGLTKGLSRELGPHGITVNAIAPGAVRSAVEDRVFADRLEAYNTHVLHRQAIKRRIMPVDIAALALFLCGEGAGLISGQNIGVDGGW